MYKKKGERDPDFDVLGWAFHSQAITQWWTTVHLGTTKQQLCHQLCWIDGAMPFWSDYEHVWVIEHDVEVAADAKSLFTTKSVFPSFPKKPYSLTLESQFVRYDDMTLTCIPILFFFQVPKRSVRPTDIYTRKSSRNLGVEGCGHRRNRTTPWSQHIMTTLPYYPTIASPSTVSQYLNENTKFINVYIWIEFHSLVCLVFC